MGKDSRQFDEPTGACGDRAQSEVVGVMLFTGVVVLLVGLVGMFLLAGVDTTSEPTTDVEIDVAHDVANLTHAGGDSLALADVTVVFGRDGDGSVGLDATTDLAGNGDDQFDGGDRRQAAHSGSEILSVTVVHEPTNTVLARAVRDVPAPPPAAVSTLSWRRAADWDAATAETNVVHESFGDHDASRLDLGAPRAGPVAYWPLDEDGGTTVADVGGGSDGTVQGATTGEPGVVGTTSVGFDGADDYVGGATDQDALRTTGSIAAWIRTTQTGDDTMWQAPGLTGVESAGDGDDVFWGWLDASGRIGVQAGNTAGAKSSTAVADGAWHHVVLTRDHGTGQVEVYVDGTREDDATSSPGEVTTSFDSIGRIEDTGGTPEYFPGRIDEVRVYDRVLSSGDVSDLYAAASSGSLATGSQTFDTARDVGNLKLRNVQATDPRAITITVESDIDGDGTIEETADPITLDGSGSHAVTGLSTDSPHFRLQIDIDSPPVTAGPTLGRVDLVSPS